MDYPKRRMKHRVWIYDAEGLPLRKVEQTRLRYVWTAPDGTIYTAPVSEAGRMILDNRRKQHARRE